MEPIKLKVKNFYTLADGEIDFGKFSSALVLGGYADNPLKSNGSGKSSIFESICWALFNETRQTKVDDVIRWTTNETIVDFEFIFGQNMYRVLRRRSRVAKESSVSFFMRNGDKWINDSGSINSETNKKILSLLKIDSKIFLNSVYFKQHDIALFATSSPSDRKDIIKSIMKLERWDEYQKSAKSRLKDIKEKIDEKYRILNENSKLGILCIENEKNIEVNTHHLDELSKKQREIQNNLYSLLELRKELNLDTLFKKLDELNKQKTELKTKGKLLQQKQQSLEQMLETQNANDKIHDDNINTLKNKLQHNENIIKKIQIENLNYVELEETIVSCRAERIRLENSIKELAKTDMIGVGECQECFTSITEQTLPHIHEKRKKKEANDKQELELLTIKLKNIETEYKNRVSNKKQLDELSKANDKITTELDKHYSQQHIIKNDIVNINKDVVDINVSIVSIVEKLKVLKIDTENIENKITQQKVNNIDNEVNDINIKNRKFLEEINSKNMELGSLLKEKEFLIKQTKAVDSATEQIGVLNKDKVIYEQLVRYFGKDGIQAVFIESVVDELEQYANTTLSYICNEPTIIKLKTQKRTGDSWQETLEIDVVMNGFPQTFESLGGGEQFRISLALRIGLSEVLVKRAGGEIKLLLLDEVDSPLDAYGLNNLFESIIKGLEKRFKILVISHNDRIRERFNNLIMVSKTTDGSFITQS